MFVGAGRLRCVTQPGEAGSTDGRVGHQQAVEHYPLGFCDAVRQDVERPLPGTSPSSQGRSRSSTAESGTSTPRERRWVSMVWTIGSPRSVAPCGVGASPQAVSPVAQSEAAQAEDIV